MHRGRPITRGVLLVAAICSLAISGHRPAEADGSTAPQPTAPPPTAPPPTAPPLTVPGTGESIAEIYASALQACDETLREGFRQNDSPGPRIAVLGDSAENQLRNVALADPALHWIYDTQCGENFHTVVDDGRLAAVLATDPHVLVLGLGNNALTEEFQFRPELVPTALADIERFLDLTDAVPCRVIVNMPLTAPVTMPEDQRAAWQGAATRLDAAFDAAQSRPGVHVADWAAEVDPDWQRYTVDTIHLTPDGINARLNLELTTLRQCPPTEPMAALVAHGASTPQWCGGIRLGTRTGVLRW